MIRKFLAALAMFAALLAGSLAVSTPAQAIGPCADGWICFWNTVSSTVPIDARNSSDSFPGECHTLPSAATSYITNRGGWHWNLYRNTTCSSWPSQTLYPEQDNNVRVPLNNDNRSYRRS